MVLSEAGYRDWALDVWLRRRGSCHVKHHASRPVKLGLSLGLADPGLHLPGVSGDRHCLGQTLPRLSASFSERSDPHVAETKGFAESIGFRSLAVHRIYHNLWLSRKSNTKRGDYMLILYG